MSDAVPTYNPLQLGGRSFLVTGASSGIGRETARVISRLGGRVVLSGRRVDALEESRLLLDRPDEHLCEPFDLAADVDAIPAWVKQIRARLDAPLDGVVHSAGIGSTSPIRAVSRKTIDGIMLPNFHATLLLLRGASAKGVMPERGASFVVISSVAALVGTKGLSAYAGSKGALHSMAKSAAHELADRRMRVNCVAPAYVETPLLTQAQTELPGQFSHLDRQFLGVIGAEEVGVAAAYLLSDAARFITGTMLVIDSGYTL